MLQKCLCKYCSPFLFEYLPAKWEPFLNIFVYPQLALFCIFLNISLKYIHDFLKHRTRKLGSKANKPLFTPLTISLGNIPQN